MEFQPTDSPVYQKHKRAVIILSCGFFCLFAGFQAAQGLQSTLNATLGYINLGTLYFTFTVGCNLSPPLLNCLEQRGVEAKSVLFVGALCYVCMVIANLDAGGVGFWGLSITANFLVGVGAGPIWICQNDLVGRCAFHGARDIGEQTAMVTSKFNGLFFSIYQFSGFTGNVLSTVILLLLGSSKTGKTYLFLVLTVFCVLGACIFLLIPKIQQVSNADEAGRDAAPQTPGMSDTFKLAWNEPRIRYLVPLIFANGFFLGSMFADFPKFFVSRIIGPSYPGFALACFFGINSLMTKFWTSLISRKKTSYFGCLFCASSAHLVFFLGLVLATASEQSESGTWFDRLFPVHYTSDSKGNWTELPGDPPPAWQYVLVFTWAAIFAIGDAAYECQVPAALQGFFQDGPHALAAMANYKLWQSLGFAVQFILGAALGDNVQIRIIICLAFLALAWSGLCCVRKQLIDLGQSRGALLES